MVLSTSQCSGENQQFHTRDEILKRYSSSDRQPSALQVDFSAPNNPISLDPVTPTHPSDTASRESGGTANVLPNERARLSFEVEKMTEYMYGGPKKVARRRFIMSPTEGTDQFDKYFWSRPELLREHIRHFFSTHEEWWGKFIPTREETSWMTNLTMNQGTMMNHYGLWLPTLAARGSPAQMMEYVPRTFQMKIIGVYAQTELGHGSNVRGLKTTAHFDKEADEFVLNTPTLDSIKWWPGTLGKVATHALVYAQLILDEKEYGIHEFIVQIREADSHRPFPGIEVGDLGPKLGDGANDTGFLRLSNVRVARDRMLAKHQHVTREGKYVKAQAKRNEKAHYATMMMTRGSMVRGAAGALSRAVTISTRYSCVRKQGFRDSSHGISYKSPEKTILDHQIQQYRIFTQLSRAYAFQSTGKWMIDQSSKFGGAGDKIAELVEEAKELTATSAGLKAMCTVMALEGIEDCRKCCGGNGYLMSSGVASLAADYAWQCTAEGDWVILFLSTSRYLMRRVRDIRGGDKLVGHFSYLNIIGESSFSRESLMPQLPKTRDGWKNLEFLRSLYHARAVVSIVGVSDVFEAQIAQGTSWDEAFNSNAVSLLQATRNHCLNLMFDLFVESVYSAEDPNCVSVLEKLAAFFGISHIVDGQSTGLLDTHSLTLARSAAIDLLSSLRPEAIGLVDAFDFPDRVLSSVLGRYDGNVYEALFEAAKKSELNQMDPFLGYEEVLKPYLDQKFLQRGNTKKGKSKL